MTSCPVDEATANKRAPSGRKESGQKRASGVYLYNIAKSSCSRC